MSLSTEYTPQVYSNVTRGLIVKYYIKQFLAENLSAQRMYSVHYFVHISVYLHLGPTLEINCLVLLYNFPTLPPQKLFRDS